MPGIFGFIGKERFPEGLISLYRDTIQSLLVHLETYKTDTYISTDQYAVGSVSIDPSNTIQHIKYKSKDYLFLIDGYVYTIDGKPAGKPSETAERVISGVIDEGDSFLPKIYGNYTISIVNKNDVELILFNDKIGPRRIYYADLPHAFVFSPEMKAISFLQGFNRELDWKGIADFFNYSYVLGDKTFFKNIKSLSSSSVLRFRRSDRAHSLKKYWHPRYTEKIRTLGEAVEQGFGHLKKSIEEKIERVGSVICPISGGLDSRVILAIIHESNKGVPVKPVTYGQRFSYEYKNARKVCDFLGYDNHSLVEINPQAILPFYDQTIWLSEGMLPLINTHLLLMPGSLGNEYKCLLNGIYGGPTNYSAEYYRRDHLEMDVLHEDKTRDIQKVIALNHNFYKDIFDASIYSSISEDSFESISQELQNHLGVSERFCSQRDAFFIENRMRRFICQSSLYRFFWEEQLPLSNYPLYDFYLSTSPELKLGRNVLKAMLREKFPQMAEIQDANTGLNLYQEPGKWYSVRKKFVYNTKYYISRLGMGKIVFYDKSTYVHYPQWFQGHPSTIDYFRKHLFSPSIVTSGLFNKSKLSDLFQDVLTKRNGYDALARLVTFATWYSLFILEQGVDDVRNKIATISGNFT